MNVPIPVPAPEGFYFVHSCGSAHTDHEEWDGCNGRFVWAPSPDVARLRSQLVERNDPLLAMREPELDSARAAIGDVFSPWRKHTEAEARALRSIGWTHDPDLVCDECNLSEFDEVPSSAVCWECGCCRECRDPANPCDECGTSPPPLVVIP